MFVLLFWAKWYPECEQLRDRMNELVPGMSHIVMGWCNVDTDIDIVEHYEITKVPFILIMHVSNRFCLILSIFVAIKTTVRIHKESKGWNVRQNIGRIRGVLPRSFCLGTK